MGLASQIQRRTIGGTAPISPFMPLKSVDFVAKEVKFRVVKNFAPLVFLLKLLTGIMYGGKHFILR